jgi:hypothetical protein
VTDLLKRAFDAVSRLPEEEQDAMAEWLLAEHASEEGWERRFAETQGALSVLAGEALKDEENRNERLDNCPDGQSR